jgi:benzoyl-CoA-dihydrodiol lyase
VDRVEFRISPQEYRHWRVAIDGPIATLVMDVDERAGLRDGYELKLNSYDLGVDIELYDIVQRLRFEHPEVRTVVMSSAKEKVFCAGANIRMLADSSHAWKVNFCKFTNETRNGMEDASANSGQTYLAAGTSWPWPATTSCWSTTAPPRCRCLSCRCSGCYPAPAA